MKMLVPVLALLALSPAALAGVAVGSAAPDFSLKDADGKPHALADYKGKVVVLEWVNCNCPFVVRHTKAKTMATLAGKYPQVAWLAVNSTNDGHGQYTSPADSKKWAAENGISYPMLFDTDGKVGTAYGAKTTPHMYVIGTDGKVAYSGAIDDDPRGSKDDAERVNYVDQALGAVLKGEPVKTASTQPYGCSVKYK
jgi:peroxiredoxin